MLADAGVGHVEVAAAEAAQVVDRRDGPRQRLERLRPGLEPVAGRVLARRTDAVGGPGLRKVAADRRDAEVRSEELVGRAQQDVDAELGAIRVAVRRVVHPVRPCERARVVRELRDAARVGDRPDRVRGQREGDDTRPVGEQRRQRVDVERRVGVVDRRALDDEAVILGDAQPRRDVRVVVEVGDDDLVAGLRRARDGVRELEVQRRHVRAERDLLRRAAGQLGGGAPCLGDELDRVERCRERTAVVGGAAAQVPGHRLDDLLGRLRAARPVEEGGVAGEGGKQRADVVRVERVLHDPSVDVRPPCRDG
jgi:hypothetical protein